MDGNESLGTARVKKTNRLPRNRARLKIPPHRYIASGVLILFLNFHIPAVLYYMIWLTGCLHPVCFLSMSGTPAAEVPLSPSNVVTALNASVSSDAAMRGMAIQQLQRWETAPG